MILAEVVSEALIERLCRVKLLCSFVNKKL